MTPSANGVIIQTIFKSVYIVFKAPKALFTVKKKKKKHGCLVCLQKWQN